MIDSEHILGVVLAGGKSRRMDGRDKALLPLDGKPLIEHVTHRLQDQKVRVAINTNAASDAIGTVETLINVPRFGDIIGDFAGPLAGVHAGLSYARTVPGITHIVTAATDTPFFPEDLVTEFALSDESQSEIAMATSQGFRHPVFALWPVSIVDSLEQWLATTDTFKVVVFARQVGMHTVDFPVKNGQDPFFNINTPDDLSVAEKRMKTQ